MNYSSNELGLTPATKKLLENRKTVPMWEIAEKKVVRLRKPNGGGRSRD